MQRPIRPVCKPQGFRPRNVELGFFYADLSRQGVFAAVRGIGAFLQRVLARGGFLIFRDFLVLIGAPAFTHPR